MSRVLEKKDLIETREVFEKFPTRYKEDRELQRICYDFMEYIYEGPGDTEQDKIQIGEAERHPQTGE